MFLNTKVTDSIGFYEGHSPIELVNEYGTPLYVYNERILRNRIADMKNLIKYPNFSVNYSAKANSNLSILKIIHSEGIDVDAMSPGEITVELAAGFSPEEILFVCNNVSSDEMKFALNKNINISVDSIAQLELLGKINYGGNVVIRFNPGIGAGHHSKVITAGANTKFGVQPEFIDDVKNILNKYNLKLIGINHHIGSLFMQPDSYVEGAAVLLSIAEKFPDIEFVDFGGGFGIPYHKQDDQPRLDLSVLGDKLDELISNWVSKTGHKIKIKIEPGRYISAECGVLLGSVHGIKYNHGRKYIGTDLGFNVLARPVMYDSHHDIEVYHSQNDKDSDKFEVVTVVGNICETGDVIAYDRKLTEIFEGDVLGVLDSGAYGHVMSSNYNNRLRPAEILINVDKSISLIRRRDTLDDILRVYPDFLK